MDKLITYRIRFLIWQKKKYNNERLKLLATINNIMNRLSDSFDRNIINQYYFNNYLTRLESIHCDYKKIYKINLNNLSFYRVKINKINEDLVALYKKTGMMNISSITSLNFCLDVKDLDIKEKNIVEFVDLVLNPTMYSIYDIKYKNIDKNEVTLYNSKENNSTPNMSIDLNNIMKLDSILFTKLKKKNSLIESTNGTRFYIAITINSQKFALVIDGYFKNDPLNISRYNGFIYEKQQALINLVDKLDIDKRFKYGYIEQISIRDLLMYNINELLINIKNAYDIVLNYKKKNISQIVKEFLSKSLEDQRDLITYFLLCDDENDFQYFAFLLYDMIMNESYLLKAQPLSDQIFNSIHWSIQKQFKNIIEKVDDYTKQLINVSDDMISYEKRICLMKTSDNVKIKAMDKLKEINNKNSENCSKAQLYLDNLLKVPFGTYKNEEVLSKLELFKNKLESYLILVLSIINDYEIKETNTCELVNYLKKFKNKKWRYDTIDCFINNVTKRLDTIRNSTNVSCNTPNKLLNIIKNKLDKVKYKQIKEIIDLFNSHFDSKIKKNKKRDLLIIDIISFLTDVSKTNIIDSQKSNSNTHFSVIPESLIKNILKKMDYDILNACENKDKEFLDKIYKEHSIISNLWTDHKNYTSKYIEFVDSKLDNSIYAQNDAKNEVKRIVGQWINGDNKGYCLGFEGPPGTGKTSLAKYGIAECLIDNDRSKRPFSFIALGGSSNGSTLEGHNYTYVGSTYGKIVEILIESKCMNPIIYIDELDKISNTDNGRELIGILTHLTDSTQNEQFMDKYFSGIPLDLSKVLFIFSYNDYNLLDSILADRIHRVKFDYLKIPEKVHIMNKYLIPNMLDIVGIDNDSISISKEALIYIIKNFTYEAGVRKLKEKVLEILRQINLESIINKNFEFSNSKLVDIEYVTNFFKDKAKITYTKIHNKPKIGLVNGLFATSLGMGGITVIEAFKTPSDTKLSLLTTGKQGDVMKESITCAKTIAWNVIPNSVKNKYTEDIKKERIQPFGIHIHCPEAATPKDGPSAGAAITLAMVSLLTNIPVNNTVAMTGEIDLNGSIHKIGGLDLKIDGGKSAGAKTFLVPEDNKDDLDIIRMKNSSILEDIEVILVNNIWQVIEYALVPQNNCKICVDKSNIDESNIDESNIDTLIFNNYS